MERITKKIPRALLHVLNEVTVFVKKKNPQKTKTKQKIIYRLKPLT
jgi:hypothetical protein